jgi:hypothetical protein
MEAHLRVIEAHPGEVLWSEIAKQLGRLTFEVQKLTLKPWRLILESWRLTLESWKPIL